MSKRSIEGVEGAEGAEGVSAAAPVAKKSKAAPLTKEGAIRALEETPWDETNRILEFMLRLPEELSADFDVWIIALNISTIQDADLGEWEDMLNDRALRKLYESIPGHFFGRDYENAFTIAAIHATNGFCVFARCECKDAAFTNKQCFITLLLNWGRILVAEAWSMGWFKGDHLDEFNIRSDPDVLRAMIQLLEDDRDYCSGIIFDIMLPPCFNAKTLKEALCASYNVSDCALYLKEAAALVSKTLKDKFAWFYHDACFVKGIIEAYGVSREDREELKAFAELFPRHMQERLMRY